MLREHMPELAGTWEPAGRPGRGGDVAGPHAVDVAAAVLPVGLLAGVSTGGPVLIRNYDYAPRLLEGVPAGHRLAAGAVIGMSDCLWGVLDGINEAGLAVVAAFGGRIACRRRLRHAARSVRYLLETCETAARGRGGAGADPARPRPHAHAGRPGRRRVHRVASRRSAVRFQRSPAATNHQESGGVAGARGGDAVAGARQRWHALLDEPALDADGSDAFLDPPLYSTEYAEGFGRSTPRSTGRSRGGRIPLAGFCVAAGVRPLDEGVQSRARPGRQPTWCRSSLRRSED